MDPHDRGRSSNRDNRDNRHTAGTGERVVAVLGILLVCGSLGYLLFAAVNNGEGPPDVRVQQAAIAGSGGDYLVQFKASNEGGETAAQVRIVGSLSRNGQQIETSEVTLDYVPVHSERKGGLYFENDPRSGQLQLRASGYQRP